MSASSRRWSDLLSLVADNAVARKDVLVLSRQRGAVVALAIAFVVALLVVFGVGVVITEGVRATDYSAHLFPHGRTLTASVAIAALALLSLLVPALSSTTLASERESGTLRLLLTTALTPGGIVIGKLLAVLHGVAAPLVLTLPLLAAGALLGAVSAVDVLFCAALLVANVLALGAVGVAASATSERVRVAPGKALGLAVLFVWGPMGLTSLVMIALWAAEGYHSEMLGGGALVLSWMSVIVVASLLIARDAIAPSTQQAREGRRRLVTLALVGAPLLAAGSLLGLSPDADLDAWSSLYLLGFGGLALVVVLGEVALRGPDGRGAWQAAARVAWRSTWGALLALPVATLCLVGVVEGGSSVDEILTLKVTVGSALPVVLWLMAAGGIAAFFTRRASSPTRRVVASAATVAALLFIPTLFASLPPPYAVVPPMDPASLIAMATDAAIAPFDARFSETFLVGGEALVLMWMLLLVGLVGLTAQARRERARERVSPRR